MTCPLLHGFQSLQQPGYAPLRREVSQPTHGTAEDKPRVARGVWPRSTPPAEPRSRLQQADRRSWAAALDAIARYDRAGRTACIRATRHSGSLQASRQDHSRSRPHPVLGTDPTDLYDLLQPGQRTDRMLPNGYCLLPPRQVATPRSSHRHVRADRLPRWPAPLGAAAARPDVSRTANPRSIRRSAPCQRGSKKRRHDATSRRLARSRASVPTERTSRAVRRA
jgi:hypothetical protein